MILRKLRGADARRRDYRMDTVSLDDFRGRIVRDTFGSDLSELDGLLVFAILHCYQIELSGPVLFNLSAEAGTRIAAITQRSCSDAVAYIWSGPDEPRADEGFWYRRWQTWQADGRPEALQPDERARMRWLMQQLERHPFVSRIVAEDFDPAAEPA